MSGHEHSGGHGHGHGHGHDHESGGYETSPTHVHLRQPDLEDTPFTQHQLLQMAVTGLLIEKGMLSAEEMRAQIEHMDSIRPARGAELVARAWVDDGFRQRLVTDSSSAAAELGMDIGPIPVLVMENTPETHNLVVCTLCSCYPRFLLGIPPDWYKSRSYRSRAVRDPRTVLAEFGTTVAPDVAVRVHDSTADMRYMVLPMRPAESDGMSEDALAKLVTRDTLIGVTVPRTS